MPFYQLNIDPNKQLLCYYKQVKPSPTTSFFKWYSYNGSTWSIAVLKEHQQQQPKTSKSLDAGLCVWVLKQIVNINLLCDIYSFSVKGIHSWWKNQAYWSHPYQSKNPIYLGAHLFDFRNAGCMSRVTFWKPEAVYFEQRVVALHCVCWSKLLGSLCQGYHCLLLLHTISTSFQSKDKPANIN